jgi:hypothetical protein
MQTESSVNGGREASIARRHALSAGKGALGANEPVRNGEPASNGVSSGTDGVSHPPEGSSGTALDGRAASLARRHALSAGKSALLSTPAERDDSGNDSRPAFVANGGSKSVGASFVSSPLSSGREASLARRRAVSAGKNALPPPSERVRDGRRSAAIARLTVASNPSAAPANESLAVAAVPPVRIGDGPHVTGLQNASRISVTGEQREVTPRAPAAKVGFVRTTGGSIVSGSLLRGNSPVTGDESGADIRITGEADARPQDDLSPREPGRARPMSRFTARARPHGASVFGFSAAGNAQLPDRGESAALEATLRGLPITGSAIGRSARVTGDEAGACRALTGDQYFAAERSQMHCGGPAPESASKLGAQRRDPVTGAKVVVAETRGGQRISGVDLERSSRVTSRTGGLDASVTGSQYSAGGTFTAPAFAAPSPTGDVPLNHGAVTGTARGASLSITGTAYYREQSPAEASPLENRVATIAERFSIRSPQRTAQLRAPERAAADAHAESRITGTFAAGADKVTGNLEFRFRPRLPERETGAARLSVTGEGRPGGVITGGAWSEKTNVTGTDGTAAVGRNPSARSGKMQPFAGARHFATFADREEPKRLVTGMFGYSSDSAAKVTLSGGAQG